MVLWSVGKAKFDCGCPLWGGHLGELTRGDTHEVLMRIEDNGDTHFVFVNVYDEWGELCSVTEKTELFKVLTGYFMHIGGDADGLAP